MTSNIGSPTGPSQLSSASPYLNTRTFAMRFTSTPRGARLARRLVAVRLDEWGVAYATEAHEGVVLVAAELATNAVRHGHVPGRDFHLSLRVTEAPRPVARVEVSDTRAERVPRSDGGRGLLLVGGIAERWGWYPRPGAPGKTVWAECALA
ncbi:ATP-binding protein [Streptomyces sp. R302]|uniref:ATP-binding protein n=1 Tax=unclassified Streptomyces TaxID=2593676 RepID=UPI00145CA4F2|nr:MULTISPECIES: ATP-binding protein [unclassified Streptomyces]NML53145.1 ATP-binding protein [Streptomyces sp. R301]NML82828.1 ATP-binding protein [Streptomyces sp. R302]